MVDNQYTSLTAIQARKAELAEQLARSSKEINGMWQGLVHQEKEQSLSPTKRMLSLVSNSAGIIDGAIFGWKMYRRLKKK